MQNTKRNEEIMAQNWPALPQFYVSQYDFVHKKNTRPKKRRREEVAVDEMELT